MRPETTISPLADLLQQYKLLQQEYEYEKELFFQHTQHAGIIKNPARSVLASCNYLQKSLQSTESIIIEISRKEGEVTDTLLNTVAPFVSLNRIP